MSNLPEDYQFPTDPEEQDNKEEKMEERANEDNGIDDTVI